MTEQMKIVGERLVEFSNLLKLDEKAFADACGIRENRMNKLMKGEGNIKVEEIIAIQNRFGVSADYLLGLYSHPFPELRNKEQRNYMINSEK